MSCKEKVAALAKNVLFDEPMYLHTSFKIGGKADIFVKAQSADEIISIIRYCNQNKIPYMIMGNGSNMLVSDKGIRGCVIQIVSGMQECRIEENEAYAQSGILMSKLANNLCRAGLTGFETLSGIPGTLGGGIYMNAGAYGGEIRDVVKEVTYISEDGRIETADSEKLDFSYRHSMFSDGKLVILSARLVLKKGDTDKIRETMNDYNKRRSDKQPIEMPSAGSTFKRPEGYFAGKLIQDSGLQGYKIGGAQVSLKHAGFVVNSGGATADDVLSLIKYIQQKVKDDTGIELETEVKLIGEK